VTSPIQVPKTVTVLRQRFQQAGLELEFSDEVGACVRVIASSRGSGVYLCSGGGSMDCAGWILDALDMTGRLVVQQDGENNLETIRECFNTDLRISVHAQNLNEFLDDVAKHRFELVVLDPTEGQSPSTIPRVASALSDGGILLLLGDSDYHQVLSGSDYLFSTVGRVGTMIARRRAGSRPRRAGGRSGERSRNATRRR